MIQIEGDLIATDLKIAFVVSRFNEFVCERLLEGALDSLARHGGNKEEVTVLRVPGAFELRKKPLMRFKKNRPIVAPVAPTNANRRGSSDASNAKEYAQCNKESAYIIQSKCSINNRNNTYTKSIDENRS